MAQEIYDSSSFWDRIFITPRLYETFDKQFAPLPWSLLDRPFRSFLWFSDQWYAPWVTVVGYLLVVQLLTLLCREKRRYTALTVVHNAAVAVESAYILWKFGLEVVKFISTNGDGYWGLYCDPHHKLDAESDFRFYQSLFYLNKYHELFDTVILVMRGNKPSFLAIFHHTIMLGVTYYNRWPYLAPAMWLSVALNLFVHVFMYSYFALQALNIPLNWARIWITRGQIIQFWIILFHALPWPYYRYQYGCLGHWSSWLWVFAPVTFINVLFLQFYIREYAVEALSNKRKKSEPVLENGATNGNTKHEKTE